MKALKKIGLIILFVGVLILAAAAYFYIDDKGFKANAVKTTGTITSIEEYGEDSHNVYVAFYVDGKEYKGQLNYYDSTMYVSKKITIYYDPANPNHFRGGGMMVATIVIGIIGGIFFITGAVMVIVSGSHNKKYRRIIAYNVLINANISGVRENLNYSVNGKHPYVLEANIQNPSDGKFYYFKSENMWQDVSPIINQLNIRTIPVYVNPNNFNEYVIHMEPIISYLGNQ